MYLEKTLSLLLTDLLLKDSGQQLYDLASFRHALSTPLTILLSLTDEYSIFPNKQIQRRYQESIRSIKQLFDSFSQDIKMDCELGSILSDIKTLLDDNNNLVSICNMSGTETLLEDVPVLRFKEAITCLINNALESNKSQTSSVLVAYFHDSQYIYIHIKDYGVGITWWKKYFIFLPFISFKNKGSGIGTYFAKRVIEHEMGGKLTVFSNTQHGTSVECILPKFH